MVYLFTLLLWVMTDVPKHEREREREKERERERERERESEREGQRGMRINGG